MIPPLDCDRIIRDHQRKEADAYFQRLYLYFLWRPWEYDGDGKPRDPPPSERTEP